MLNTLLFVHLVVAILLIIVILLQRTSADGLSGLSSASGGMGLVSSGGVTNFLTRTTVILAIIFFVNAIVLANLSTKSHSTVKIDVENTQQPKEASAIPIAQ